jgi:secondary thiamine-phosphate synthase enzyme
VVELSGGGDLAARMLSLYTPPPYLAACSQGAFTRAGGPVLARNYDYAPSRFEGLIWSTRMLERRVIGTSDCLWGLLDGVNDAGLAVSLTFGGRRVLGEGFGIPIVVRYVLEVCETVREARGVLARLPFSLAHNLTLVDRTGEVLTAYVSPDRPAIFRSLPAATNHQGEVEWPEQAVATRTIEREQRIVHLAQGEAADADAGAAVQHRVCARLGHLVHGGLPPGRGLGRLPVAYAHLAAGVRRLRRRGARRGARRRGRRRTLERRDGMRRLRTETFQVQTGGRRAHDVTPRVAVFASSVGGDGLLHVFVPHATAGVVLMETGSGSESDLDELLERVFPRDDRYAHRHGSIGHGGDHLMPVFVSPSLVVPVVAGALQLGTWQSVVLVDPNRENDVRSVRLSFVEG